jgi:hypothetical protein
MRRPGRRKIYKEILSRSGVKTPRAMLVGLRRGKQHKGRRKNAGI